MKQRYHFFFVFILILVLGRETFAITKTSSLSGNWSAPATWGGGSVPTAGDDVIINGGCSVTVDVSNAACLSIQLGGSALNTGTGTLSFASGSQLMVSGMVNIGPFNSNSTAGSFIMTNNGTLICEGLTLLKLGTWTAVSGTIELTATNIIPSDNNINFNNLTLSGGTTSLPRNVTVNGNLVINTGATLNGGANTLSVGGNWINNGTFTGNTGTVSFIKNGNQTITGTGLNNFNLIRVNMGTSISNTLEVLSANFSAADPFLTITNGTFKLSGTFTFANTFTIGPSYNIDPTAGFWINNPNATVNAQAGNVSVKGLLRLSAGTYNVGTSTDNSLTYVAGSAIIMEGGTLHIAGQLTRNNATATTSYTQSGGIVSVVERGSTDPTFAGFDLGAVGSSYTMSGGTIVIRNATSAPADYVNASSVSSVTGGTLQIGDENTIDAQTFRIQSARPIGNLYISNSTLQTTKPTVQLLTSLNAVGNISIKSGTTLNAGGFNVTLGGDWSNDGIFSNVNNVAFNGTGAQVLSNPSGETFGNLTVNKITGTLSLNNSVTVTNTFAFTQGTIAVGVNTFTLNGTVTGAGTITSSITGTVNYNQNSAGQNVFTGNYGNLIFSDQNKTLAATDTIGIAGTFTPGLAAGHTVAGSTFNFNGSSQIIPAFSYNNLRLSGSGTKTGSGTLTVSGNLINGSGVIFSGTDSLHLIGTTHTNNGTLNTSILSVGTGATLTNNGAITVSTRLNGTGTLLQGTTGVLNIGGTTAITTLNTSAVGNMVNYTGTGQTVTPLTYHHLTLSGTGTPNLTGVSTINGNFTLTGTVAPSAATGMSIGGNVTIGSGTSFDAGSFSHFVKGNWSNAGTFNAGTSTITLNSTSAQTINGSTFYNLVVNNAAGISMLSDETITNAIVLSNGTLTIGGHTLTLNDTLTVGSGTIVGGTSSNIIIAGSGTGTILPAVTLNNLLLNRASGCLLTGDVTINGTLTITNGIFSTGANSVILSSGGSITEVAGKPIVGTVKTTRNISATTGKEFFGNIGVDIILNGVALGNTTVLRKTAVASTGNGHSSIKRYFDITPATNTSLNAGLVFHYDTTDVVGQNSSTLEMYKSNDNGVTWHNYGGIVNTVLKTISMTGVDDFSRWTASDTSNRVGSTPAPATVSINPASRTIGGTGFTLTVNGSGFVNGKSVVRYNGSVRATSFISSVQLTTSILSSDLQIAGTYPLTVFNIDGGGLSNSQTFTVNPLPSVKVQVETAANGSGTIVPSQILTSGSSITVYTISRDSLNNFVANVPADSWSLKNIIGGIVAGDLVLSPDHKSAVFTGHRIGSADINATSGQLITAPSGTISVTHGAASKIIVETAANGSGKVVPADTLVSGSSITVYAITRDSMDNFVANVAADAWSLQNIVGSVVATDLVPASDNKSAVFTGHAAGSVKIMATSGTIARILSGTLTISPVTGVGEEMQPRSFSLMQNFPNPFNPTTAIGYQLSTSGLTTLNIYDAIGREVSTLVNEAKEAGYYTVQFDGAKLSSGIYYARLTSSGKTQTRKLLLMK